MPGSVAEREIAAVRRRLALPEASCRVEEVRRERRPGQRPDDRHARPGTVTEIVTGFGEKGVSAENVANRAVDEARAYLAAGVPVGAHLADQLLVPLAVAGGGSFRTVAPTPHTRTNADVIARFLPVRDPHRRRSEATPVA